MNRNDFSPAELIPNTGTPRPPLDRVVRGVKVLVGEPDANLSVWNGLAWHGMAAGLAN